MNNKATFITISGVVVLLVIILVAWRSLSPAEVIAPTDEARENDTISEEETRDSSGQLLQIAPDDDESNVPMPGDAPVAVEEGDEEVSDETESVTVSMTDSGFSPDTITVAAGTTVVFVNDGQASKWPASDPHPSHSILPEFDAKRPLSTGESFSYTFEEVGEWSYHDHLNIQLRGRVVVE